MTNTLLYRSGVFVAVNKSGSHLDFGAVGRLTDDEDRAFTTVASAGYKSNQIVVVMEPGGIDDDAQGMVACAITVPKVLLDGDAELLDFIKTSSTGGLGTPHAGPMQAGDFAQVIDISDDPAAPAAVMFGKPEQQGAAGATALKTYWEPDAPPASPSAYDDEFDNGNLDVKWTELDFGSKLTVNESSVYNRIIFTHLPGSGHSVAGLSQAIPAGDFSITCKVGLSHTTGNSFEGGLALWENQTSGSDIKTLSYRAAGGMNRTATIDLFTAYNANSVGAQIDVYTGSPHPRGLYLRIRRNSTNYYYDWSADGIHWDTYSTTSNPGFTPGYMGIFTNNSPSSITRYATFEHFRYFNSDVGMNGLLAGQLAGIYE